MNGAHVNVGETRETVGAGPLGLTPDPVRELLQRVRGIVVGAEEAIEHYNARCEQEAVMADRLDRAIELLRASTENLETSATILRASSQSRIVTPPARPRAPRPKNLETPPTPPG